MTEQRIHPVDNLGGVRYEGAGTLALRPAASAVPGGVYYRTDGPDGVEESYSDGVTWRVASEPTKFTQSDIADDYVVSGFLPTAPSPASRTATIPAGIAYVSGIRRNLASSSKTFTAAKDTYADLTTAGAIAYLEVANGAAAPAIPTGAQRLFRAVTDADVAQRNTIDIVVASATTAQTDTVTINGVAVSFTSDASPTEGEIALGLVAAINNSTNTSVTPVTAATTALAGDATASFTITAKTPGVPFTISVSANLTNTLTTANNTSKVTGVTDLRDLTPTLRGSASGGASATIDGISNPDGNIDLVAGTGITITPDDAANTITFASSGGSSGPPKGHLIGGAQRWDSGIAYSVEPGEALVNGTLLSWSAAISRTNLALTASSIHYVYLYSNAGTPALLESTTAPAWDVTLGYFKLGGASPDASRRCVGFVRTDGTGNLYRFFSTAVGRTREWFILFPNTADISASSVVSGGTSTAAWASLSLASFVPAHATHFFAAAKIAFAATSDDGILGLAPVDLGTSAAFAAPYTVRDSAPKASTKTFFGRVWAPIGANASIFYRLQIIAGSPTAEVECHGARFVV